MVLKSFFKKLFVLNRADRQAGNRAIGQTGKQASRHSGWLAVSQKARAFWLTAQKQPEAGLFLGKCLRKQGQLGQVTIELVLILTLLVGIATVSSNLIKEGEWAKQLIGKPWAKISGMIESGTWEVNGGGDYHQFQPAVFPPSDFNHRQLSVRAENVQ